MGPILYSGALGGSYLFGIYVMLEGILALVVAARRRGRGYGWLFGLEGVLGIAVGLCAFVWPGLTAVVLLPV